MAVMGGRRFALHGIWPGDMNIDPRSLRIRMIGTHIGMEDQRNIEELWGAPCFDAYGTHESGMMAAECSHQSGKHVQEDAYILEIADPETGKLLADGEKGTVYFQDQAAARQAEIAGRAILVRFLRVRC